MVPSGCEGVAQEPVLTLSLLCLWRPSDLLNLLLKKWGLHYPGKVSMDMESVCRKLQFLSASCPVPGAWTSPSAGRESHVIGLSVVPTTQEGPRSAHTALKVTTTFSSQCL